MAGNDWDATQTWSALGDLERRLQSWQSSVSHCVDAWGRQVTQEYDFYKDRVQRVRDALNASGGIAYQMIARKLSGIDLSTIWNILVGVCKDIALYYGGSVVIGAAVGAGIGVWGGGVGAIPGAAAGAAVGSEVGGVILSFLGLKSLYEGLKATIPPALDCYKKGIGEAWGAMPGRKAELQVRPEAASRRTLHAASEIARGHVLLIMAILIALVAYLTRGKGDKAKVLQEIRESKRLGPKVADWVEENEGKLLKDKNLQPEPARSIKNTETSSEDSAPRSQRGAQKASKPTAGSDAHKAARWKEYQDNGGTWSYDRWSKVYDANMTRASAANDAVDAYHETLGWGEREVTVDANVDGVDYPRRLDIADVATQRGIEYKTGYQTATQDNLWEVARDKSLVDSGWDIQWVFRDSASQPLKDALDEAGIGYKVGN